LRIKEIADDEEVAGARVGAQGADRGRGVAGARAHVDDDHAGRGGGGARGQRGGVAQRLARETELGRGLADAGGEEEVLDHGEHHGPIILDRLARHLDEVRACRRCPEMIGPVVTPRPVAARVYLVGQAPGPREGALGRPFAWTAGKQLFRWFEGIGVNEEHFRSRAWLAAVCRCFPGKTRQGGDRVPSPAEVASCSGWMQREIELLRPALVIPVGKLAIATLLPGSGALVEVVGRRFRRELHGHACDVIPLPHPSGASTWFKMEPGRALTEKALRLLSRHPAWRALRRDG